MLDAEPWDHTREFPHDTEIFELDAFYTVVKKLLKVVYIVVIGALNVLCVVGSKMTLLFIASSMNLDAEFFHPNSTDDVRCGTPRCVASDQDVQLHSVRWIWSMTLCVGTPYVLSFLQAVWILCFKNKKRPSVTAVAWVSA